MPEDVVQLVELRRKDQVRNQELQHKVAEGRKGNNYWLHAKCSTFLFSDDLDSHVGEEGNKRTKISIRECTGE